MTPRRLARRAARRADLIALEKSLLREVTRGLAAAAAILLGASAAIVTLELRAPLAEETRTIGLALGAAVVASSFMIGLTRGLRRRTTDLEAAFAIDRSLGLEGALPVALELEESTDALARLAVAEATERARGVDLARAIPRTPPPESVAAPWLAVATAACAFVLHSSHAAPEPAPRAVEIARRSPAEAAAISSAARVLRDAIAELDPEARALDQELGEPGPASRALDALDREARALARGTSTRKGALEGIAAARGRVEGGRPQGLGEALEGAREALATAPALAPLAQALDEGDPEIIKSEGRRCAERLRSGGLSEDAQAQAASAAARAARGLEGSSSGEAARSALERLARALDQETSPDERAQAANGAGEKLAQARAAAASDSLARRALDALDKARDAAKGDRSSPGEKKHERGETAGGKSEKTNEKPEGEGQGGSRKGGERSTDARSGKGGQGGRDGEKKGGREGSGSGADVARGKKDQAAGSGLGSNVAGKGGTNEEEGEPGKSSEPNDEVGGPTSSLAGLLGSRGASAVFAVRGLAKGSAPTPHERDVIQGYRRAEEEALERELVPLDQRKLVQRYFETIGGSR